LIKGRSHDSDIRITDISVSRFHAKIKYERGNYYLEDMNSKFGTLALIKGNFKLNNFIHKVAL
jgi:pSer/pThr/pTyr-binding forkhead associated (FHA) protein